VNYYEILGISQEATPEVINAKHKSLAKMYHPDINSSKEAHEKMALFNEANDVLSDTVKREKYDDELRQNQQQQRQNHEIKNTQAVKANRSRSIADVQERAEKAELLRKKTETRLKTVAAAKKQRMAQAQQKAEEETQKRRRAKAEIERLHVINGLSDIVMDDTVKRQKNIHVDEERHQATKVLLSMVKKDDKHLRRMAEEAERKQRIEDILTLVKEYNEKKEWI